MGSSTLRSLPGCYLPDRRNIVLFILDIGEKIKINYYGKESEVYGS